MAIERRDLSELLETNTLVFENIPDLDNNTEEDGEPRVWKIKPLTVEREARAEKARMRNTSYLQHIINTQQQRWKAVEAGVEPKESKSWADDEEDDPLVTAEQWGPIVAAMVCEPELDPDDLIANFHGLTLRYIGEEAEGFFRDAPERIRKDIKENRAARRTKR